MSRTKYSALALATALASLFGCANPETSSPLGNSVQPPAPATGSTPPASTPTAGTAPTQTASSNTPAAGAAGAAGTGSLPSAETATPTGSIDPVGVWWTEVETDGSEVLPWVGNLMGAKIRFVMRVEVSGAAPNHDVKFDFCQLQTEWTDPVDANNITTIGFRPDSVKAFSESVVVDLGGLDPGSKVPLPKIAFRGGLDENGEEIDDNADGNPAVTAYVKTLLGIEIEVYEMITINATLDLTAPDNETLMGTVDFAADAEIVSSNNVIIAAGTIVTITPDSKTVPLVVKRLPGGGDCSAVPSTVKFSVVPPPPAALFPAEGGAAGGAATAGGAAPAPAAGGPAPEPTP